jgi:hypothetical protein
MLNKEEHQKKCSEAAPSSCKFLEEGQHKKHFLIALRSSTIQKDL